MVSEKEIFEPYGWEELLSFDRLGRAVRNRVQKRLEQLLVKEFPVSQARIQELTAQEWQRAKEAVLSSSQAREAVRKHFERIVIEEIDKLIREEKPQLELLGVAEKSL